MISYIDSLFDDAMERAREWRKMAENLHIPIVEDEALKKKRHDDAMAAIQAEYGIDM